MAKRKNSTALFEVIHAGKNAGKVDRKADGRPDRGGVAAVLKTPRWWFKGRVKEESASAATAALDPNDPTANVTAATLFQSRQRVVESPAPVAPPAEIAPALPTLVAEAPAPAAAVVDLPAVELSDSSLIPVSVRIDDPEPVAAPAAPAPRAASRAAPTTTALVLARDANPSPTPAGGRMGMTVAFDGDNREVTLRMRYTTALATGFVVLVIIGLAYVIGRRMSHGPAPATAADVPPSTAQLRRGPAQPGALDVPSRTVRTATPPAAGRPAGAAAGGPIGPINGAYFDAPTDAAGNAQRMMNMNYLLIMAFPPDQKQAAIDARDWFIVNARIPCTVERDSSRLHIAKGWYGVVGTRGFPAGLNSSAEYKSYFDVLQAAITKYPNRAKVDKRPPVPFKWVE